jgi:tetratricopeptide (TPR) repeat protein
VAGRRAFDYYYNFNSVKSPDTIYNLFKKAIDINQEKTDYFVINPFSKILLDRFEAKQTDTAETKKYANILLNAIKYGSANCKAKECQSWEIIKNYAPVLLEYFEQIPDFYSPEFYKEKYLAYYLKNGSNCDTVDIVYRKLLLGGCNMKDPDFENIIKDRNTRCYVAPPEPGPLTKAYEFYNNGKYQKAVNSFEDFIEQTEDKELKAKYSILIAKIYYADMKDFPSSRKWALKAAGFKSGWGEPYILIGKLYASSGPLCGPGTGWDSQIVTWPAIDKFEYAKKVDPKVAPEANKLIRNYEQYMPDIEELHSRMIKEGQVFRVGCWINETTTIRAARN